MRRVGCSGLIAGIVLIVAAFLAVHGWGGAGPATHTVTVEIPQGATLASAARDLERAGAILSAFRSG